MNMRTTLYWIFLMAIAARAGAYEFRIEGDRLTISAKGTPLQVLLRSFAHAGVRVDVDPRIDLRVNGACTNEAMERALDDLLDDVSYVLVWDIVKGPLGDLPRLAEMQVFLPGQRGQAKPLAPP